VRTRARAGEGMAGALEAGVAADVDVWQVTGAWPLGAVGRLARRALRPRDTRPLQHLPDCRVRKAGDGSNQPWSPARLPAAGPDPLLQLGGELTRAAVWSTRAIEQTSKARTRGLARLAPTMPPAVCRCRRDAEGRRGGLDAHSSIDCPDKREAASQSALGVTVNHHPGPILGE
jgi:hypothetical protein